MEPSSVILAIGSNLGNCHQYLLSAEQHLLKIPGCEQFIFSSIYKTISIGDENSPDYLNAAVSFRTEVPPHQLLDKLLAIEFHHGRKRLYKNAPRILDLDIIFYGNKIISDITLTLPHPRMHERFFVLTPLAEISPAIIHPLLNKTVAALESELSKHYCKNEFITKTDLKFKINND